jgi:hypothetical protein
MSSISRTETDFARIAAELRRASAEARRDAERNPARFEDLKRKAEHLARAAARIQADAHARENFIVLNEGVDA